MIDKKDYGERVDTLRGLACILLVFFHLVGNTPDTGLKLQADSYYLIFNQVFENIRMPLFSFLGGIVFAIRPQKYKVSELIAGKFKRLIVPLFFVGVPFVYIKNHSGLAHVERDAMTFSDYFDVLWLPVDHFWFLQSMFLVFIFFSMLNLLRYNYKNNIWKLFLFSVVLSICLPNNILIFSFSGFLFLFPYFILGMICKYHSDKIENIREVNKVIGLIIVIVFILLFLTKLSFTIQGVELDRISVFCMSLSMVSLLSLLVTVKVVKPLVYIGKLSFSIYLYHIFFIGFSRKLLTTMGVGNVEINIVFGIAMTIILSWCVDSFCKKYKYLWVFIGTFPKNKNRVLS
tara:strand:- start:9867 stop:10901 length:1035 start_codon:yes stop_codon:yes gene_type:complete